MTNFLKAHWRLCAVLAVLLLLFLIPRVTQYLAERAVRHADATAATLRGEADAAKARAVAAETKAAQIEIELATAKQQSERLAGELATANQRLQQARSATQAARVNYDKVFNLPIPADADVDIRLLCAKLAEQGYPCADKPKR